MASVAKSSASIQQQITQIALISASSPDQIKQLLQTTHKAKEVFFAARKEWIDFLAQSERYDPALQGDLRFRLQKQFEDSEQALAQKIAETVKSIFPKANESDQAILSDFVLGFPLLKRKEVYLFL